MNIIKTCLSWRRPCDGLPDDETLVLVCDDDGAVWLAYPNDGYWWASDGAPIATPCWWAHPTAPASMEAA